MPTQAPTGSIELSRLMYDCDVDDPSFSAELPGKQNPLDHFYTAYSFPLLLALE
jgi:hypothetical protein